MQVSNTTARDLFAQLTYATRQQRIFRPSLDVSITLIPWWQKEQKPYVIYVSHWDTKSLPGSNLGYESRNHVANELSVAIENLWKGRDEDEKMLRECLRIFWRNESGDYSRLVPGNVSLFGIRLGQNADGITNAIDFVFAGEISFVNEVAFGELPEGLSNRAVLIEPQSLVISADPAGNEYSRHDDLLIALFHLFAQEDIVLEEPLDLSDAGRLRQLLCQHQQAAAS